jgi:hypothetical protein
MSRSIDDVTTKFITDLYDISKINDEELKLWNESYSYKGFDRINIIRQLSQKVGDVKICQQIILVCGLLGPQRASQMKLLNGKIISTYGIPASGAKGTENISCQRITASTADLCAYLLKKIGSPKRINIECPAWLQFPSAGSISLPNDLRIMHIEFSRKFSLLIGGSFNEQIYDQMVINSYYDPNLRLFNDLNFSSGSTPLPSSSSSSTSTGYVEKRAPKPVETKKPP